MSIIKKQENKACLSVQEKYRPRILYVVGDLGTGGLERQLYYLLQAMNRERYKPVVVVWNYHEQDTYVPWIRSLDVPLKFFPQTSSSMGKLVAFCQLVHSLKPQLVHSYSFYTNFAAWCSTLGSTRVSIGSFRQDFLTERRVSGRLLGPLSGWLPPNHIANSHAAKQNAEQFSWFSKFSNIYIVRNGIDINQYSFHPLKKQPPLLFAAGRLFPEKRWDRLLISIAFILRTGELEFSLHLAGEGPLRKTLEEQVKDFGLERHVHFLGLRQDIPELLQHSTFLVHAADAEGCPNIVMEAMACGRAVVSTDAGDIPYLVDDGETGFVVPRGDDEKLANRIMQLMRNHQLCERMGNAGRVKAEREFGVNRLVQETFTAYQVAGWKGG